MQDKDFLKSVDFEQEATMLRVLGHPIRFKIVAGLMSQRCNVGKIWQCLEIPQAVVSQHLALLQNVGIIRGERKANEVYYSVSSEMIRKIVASLLDRNK